MGEVQGAAPLLAKFRRTHSCGSSANYLPSWSRLVSGGAGLRAPNDGQHERVLQLAATLHHLLMQQDDRALDDADAEKTTLNRSSGIGQALQAVLCAQRNVGAYSKCKYCSERENNWGKGYGRGGLDPFDSDAAPYTYRVCSNCKEFSCCGQDCLSCGKSMCKDCDGSVPQCHNLRSCTMGMLSNHLGNSQRSW